ncbi:MAG TPA: GAF domain-containing sensor histidine kinase [Gaiellaceae bacterium]|nr:GAF domain-containing sensor histidine kinase [Gaiellaceae bacterium]
MPKRRELERRRSTEIWIAWVRMLAVPWAIAEVALISHDYPPGYKPWAWAATIVLAAGALTFFVLARLELGERARSAVGLAALVFDTGIIYAYVFVYVFETGTPTVGIVYLAVIEAALRYGLVGGIVLPLATFPLLALTEWWRADQFSPPDFDPRYISLPFGIQVLMGLIVGWLVGRLRGETIFADVRAAEAEGLRDQLGRRADQLEAVNRASRALGSSLDQEHAFQAFIREMKGIFDFERLAVVLATGDRAEVMAVAGPSAERPYPVGSSRPIKGSILEDVLADGQTLVRGDMEEEGGYPEEVDLAAAGLRSRIVAPLAAGERTIGILSVCRSEAHAFSADEAEMMSLLARQVATVVQNIRVYEAERNAAEELRRLSALRADFVSLVSHELRAPMASVIGCAQTLRQRWRELAPDQRESFLALIEGETARLAMLIGDVLDTSRIEAGTFPFTFGQVDLEELVREASDVVRLGQEEVRLNLSVTSRIPPVRGDPERLRQLLLNLLSNAVKYTVAGDDVEVTAVTEDGAVAVSVTDHGPGIPREEQRLIFEKFGRVNQGGKAKPGAGLGLFIARSIAEAHGGSLEVDSEPGAGATFTLRLPLARP